MSKTKKITNGDKINITITGNGVKNSRAERETQLRSRKVYTCSCEVPMHKAALEMYAMLDRIKDWLIRNSRNVGIRRSMQNMVDAAEEIEELLKKARGEE